MMSAGQWRTMRALETSALINSTKAGQRMINGIRRPEMGVVRPTKSNPQGFCMVRRGPMIPQPFENLGRTAAIYGNLVKQASGIRVNRASISQTSKWVPLQDIVRHNQAKAASE